MSAADNLNHRQTPGFRMVTNMKAAPGSQGTLFQGGNPRAGDGQPWPRRFSPQRRDEVRDAMGFSATTLRGNRGGKSSRAMGDDGGAKPENARGIEVVARSTVPVEHIEGARYSFGQYQSKEGGPLGEYRAADPSSDNPYRRKASVANYKGATAGTTPIHEIGHHVSAITGTPHAGAGWGNSDDEAHLYVRRGQEEGFAENYAETHYRDHRGRPLVNFETSPQRWRQQYEMGDEHDPNGVRFQYFQHGFNQERAKSPSAQLRRARNAALAKPSSPSGIVGQLPLLHRVSTPSREYINTRGDRAPDIVSWSYANLDANPEYMPSHPWRTGEKK